MNIREIEALVVSPDEVLVIKVDEYAFDDSEKLTNFLKAMDETSLKGRYIVFSGRVEFSKVQL